MSLKDIKKQWEDYFKWEDETTGDITRAFRLSSDARESIRKLIALAEASQPLFDPDCNSFHHKKKDYHDIGAECPVKARFMKALAELEGNDEKTHCPP